MFWPWLATFREDLGYYVKLYDLYVWKKDLKCGSHETFYKKLKLIAYSSSLMWSSLNVTFLIIRSSDCVVYRCLTLLHWRYQRGVVVWQHCELLEGWSVRITSQEPHNILLLHKKKLYRPKEPYHLSSFVMILGHEEGLVELGFTHFAFSSSNISKAWAFLTHADDVG